jgi:hypothetical protein
MIQQKILMPLPVNFSNLRNGILKFLDSFLFFQKIYRVTRLFFFFFSKATTKLKASVLFFALIPSPVNSKDLYNMVILILSRAKEIQETEKLIGLATLDNQTPLARALCHPAVTTNLVEKLLDHNHEITEKQLLVVFDTVACNRGHISELLKCLTMLVDWLKKHNGQATLKQLPYIFCRHNNVLLLKWFYDNVDTVRSNLKISVMLK